MLSYALNTSEEQQRNVRSVKVLFTEWIYLEVFWFWIRFHISLQSFFLCHEMHDRQPTWIK